MSKRFVSLVVVLFIFSVLIRMWCFGRNGDNLEYEGGDEPWSKINLAQLWIDDPNDQFPDLNFGPLHTYLIATFLYADKDKAVLYSRYVSLLFGIFFPVLCFYLLQDIFDNKTAVFGLFLFALYPLHILLSTVSMPETIACFMVFSSVYLCMRFFAIQGMWRLVFSALALNLACMLRFECWLFVPFFPFCILLQRRSLKEVFSYGCIASIFPVFWMKVNYDSTGDIINFMHCSSGVAQFYMRDIDCMSKSLMFVSILSKTLTLCVVCFGVVGLVISLVKRNKGIMLAAAFLYMLGVFTFLSMKGAFNSFLVRYSILLGVFFLPFAAYGLAYFYERRKTYIVLGVCMLIACQMFATIKTNFSYVVMEPETQTVVRWMSENIKRDQLVLLEKGVRHPYLVLNGNIKEENTVDYNPIILQGGGHIDFSEYVKKCSYIIMSKNKWYGQLSTEVLPLLSPDDWAEVFENTTWMIYQRERHE